MWDPNLGMSSSTGTWEGPQVPVEGGLDPTVLWGSDKK